MKILSQNLGAVTPQFDRSNPCPAGNTAPVAIAIDPLDLLLGWLARAVKTGAGDSGTLEKLAASLTYAEAALLGAVPPPWRWTTPPIEIYEKFAQASGYALDSARAAWREISAFALERPYPYSRLLAIRPISEIQAAVERQRLGAKDQSDQTLIDELQNLLNQDLRPSDLTGEILSIARRQNCAAAGVWQLYRTLESESDSDANLDRNRRQLDELEEIATTDPSACNFIDPRIGNRITRYAELVGVSSMAIFVTLLSAVASVAPGASRLELHRERELYARPVLWSMVVARSGAGKSPAQSVVTKALYLMQSEEWDRYQTDLAAHKADEARAKTAKAEPPEPPPPLHHYLTTDATAEAIARIQAGQQDAGFLIHHDEISALFNSQNAYRAGRGSDREKLLSGRDGLPLKVDRAGKDPLYAKACRYSITGTTQLETLAELVSRGGGWNDNSGQFARFSPVVMSPRPCPWDTGDIREEGSLSGLIGLLLKAVERQPGATYTLSHEAAQQYGAWWDACDSDRLHHPQPAFQSIYSKAKVQAGELALLLHLLDAAIAGRPPEAWISEETVVRAIALQDFFINQWKLIHGTLAAADRGEEISTLHEIWALAQKEGSIAPRDLQRLSSKWKKFSSDKLRDLFRRLEKLGRGRIEGQGRSLRLVADPPPEGESTTSASPPTKPLPNLETGSTYTRTTLELIQ
ncbi:MAG: hypothetical protein Fur0046_22900 [Cyanobacteria bacterium J069]|nr:MAG: DUF3987 domain-containing protein [Cyanobacteria bacterium J069]